MVTHHQASRRMSDELRTFYQAYLETLTIEELEEELKKCQLLLNANSKITKITQRKACLKSELPIRLTNLVAPCLKRLVVASGAFSMRLVACSVVLTGLLIGPSLISNLLSLGGF